MITVNRAFFVVVALSILGCASSPTGPVGTYRSPNGGFTYEIPPDIFDEPKVTEDILPQGGNVQFFYGSHFKRIDYAIFNPAAEKEIQEIGFRKRLLENFTMGAIVPAISRYVPGAKVKESVFEEQGGVPVFYVSMLLPQASTTSLNGTNLDECRCMLTHSNGKLAYVFTVSAEVDDRGATSQEEAFAQTEKWLKQELSLFFSTVEIQ
jgi:hypothetical protein